MSAARTTHGASRDRGAAQPYWQVVVGTAPVAPAARRIVCHERHGERVAEVRARRAPGAATWEVSADLTGRDGGRLGPTRRAAGLPDAAAALRAGRDLIAELLGEAQG